MVEYITLKDVDEEIELSKKNLNEEVNVFYLLIGVFLSFFSYLILFVPVISIPLTMISSYLIKVSKYSFEDNDFNIFNFGISNLLFIYYHIAKSLNKRNLIFGFVQILPFIVYVSIYYKSRDNLSFIYFSILYILYHIFIYLSLNRQLFISNIKINFFYLIFPFLAQIFFSLFFYWYLWIFF